MAEPSEIPRFRLTAAKVAGLTFCLGLAIIAAGFLYDVEFAGIPYQDPTPELTAKYNFHSSVASWIMRAGLGVCLLAIPIALVQKIRRRNV